jgi:exosortase
MQIEREATAAEERGWVGAAAPHLLWVVPFAALFAPTAAFLFDRWTRSIWQNGHGLFIPLIVGYLIWDHFRRRPLGTPEPSALGFLFLVPGLAAVALDTAIRTELLGAAGLVLCLPGLALLLVGAKHARGIAFPLALSAFMLPIPAAFVEQVHLSMRLASAVASGVAVRLLGIPVIRDGTTLLIPRGFVEVSDACSGFSTLYASVTLAIILAYLTPGWGRRVLLLGAAPLLALVCNAIRVSILVLLAHFIGFDLLKTSAHEISGMVSFVVALAGLFALADKRGLRGELP